MCDGGYFIRSIVAPQSTSKGKKVTANLPKYIVIQNNASMRLGKLCQFYN